MKNLVATVNTAYTQEYNDLQIKIQDLQKSASQCLQHVANDNDAIMALEIYQHEIYILEKRCENIRKIPT